MTLILCDPGHGGIDPGNVHYGIRESDVNLALGIRFRDRATAQGFNVMMTRSKDVLPIGQGTISQDLDYRAALANHAQVNLYLSFHTDAATDSSVQGIAAWIHPNAKGTRTETWARIMVKAIAAATRQKLRGLDGICYGDFAVLRETSMEAVLIEFGFGTNADESQRMVTSNYQRVAVEALVESVCGIFGLSYKPESTPAVEIPVNAEVADAIKRMKSRGLDIDAGYWVPNAQAGQTCDGGLVAIIYQRAAYKLTGKLSICASEAVKFLKQAGVEMDANYWLLTLDQGQKVDGDKVAAIFQRIAAKL